MVKSGNRMSPITALCRDEATRTPDPYVPNVVRYQLRYIPSLQSIFGKSTAKVVHFFEIRARKAQNFKILAILLLELYELVAARYILAGLCRVLLLEVCQS